MKIAIDIDGVVQAIGHIPDREGRRRAFAEAPCLPGAPSAIARLCSQGHDVFFATGRNRWSHSITSNWMRGQDPQIDFVPMYYMDTQAAKPAFLRLLAPDVIIDDNPWVIDMIPGQGLSAKGIWVHDPSWHNWPDPRTLSSTYWDERVTVVRSLAEAVPVVEEMVRLAAALSGQRTA